MNLTDVVPFSITQPTPYFMPAASTIRVPPPPINPATPMIRFPIPPFSQTALALRDALEMVPPGYSANITHINRKYILWY
ncbi:unnamed protein product [Gongylonema pulchrum]|uniref:Suf domain-containing protein n=1 Tax=Gongylonema pulchrum TaxID=637853 RepID=A0A183DYE4_9BILA|nr:unnamed protein product [Gongylonema pulchrum]